MMQHEDFSAFRLQPATALGLRSPWGAFARTMARTATQFNIAVAE
jgi:hypothetical protein